MPSALFSVPLAVHHQLCQRINSIVLSANAGCTHHYRTGANGNYLDTLRRHALAGGDLYRDDAVDGLMAGDQYFARGTDFGFSLLVGASLLLLSNVVWLINRYRFSFRAADAIIAASYFGGHFLIVRSLYL